MAENQGNATDRLTYFLVGAGIGAAVAILFAPKAGRELRGEIADASRKGIDYTRQGAHLVGQRSRELYGQTAQRAQDAIAAGREQVAQRREQLQSAISAGKEAYQEEKHRAGTGPALSPGSGTAGGGTTGGPTGGGNA